MDGPPLGDDVNIPLNIYYRAVCRAVTLNPLRPLQAVPDTVRLTVSDGLVAPVNKPREVDPRLVV